MLYAESPEEAPSWVPGPASGPVLTGGYPPETARNHFKKRLGIGFFSLRLEVLLWPFYFNHREWLSLVIVLAIGLSMIIGAFSLGVFD